MSAELRRDYKWWGWGDPTVEPELDATALAALFEALGGLQSAPRPQSADEVTLPEPHPLPAAIIGAVGGGLVSTEHEDRLRHAAGKGYIDLARVRSGRLEAAPDAVVAPGNAAEVGRILEICAAEEVAVVPFGGGTSVVGGVEPLREGHRAVISLDLVGLREVVVDRTSLTARLGAGLRGPEAEAALNGEGLTLGHFPQSFEYATIGGFAATRSAGQASSGYGRFDALVTSARLIAPVGAMETIDSPHTAAGPALRELIIGSEGALGILPDVTVRVRPAPRKRRYEAWFVESFSSGAEIVRSMAQDEVLPDVIRVSDEEETRFSLLLSGPKGRSRSLFERYLRLRGVAGGCLMIVGFEGEREAVDRRRALAARKLRAGGAAYIGQRPGRSWERGRYQGPYLRDTLMDTGALVETLETSHTWTRLEELYRAVARGIRGALEQERTPPIVFCHLSHAYPDGASLYFTFIARAKPGEELDQWAAAKRAACEAIVATGGTITHHHAIGRDHVPYMEAEVGETGIEALRALKERLDPSGIMNPGKLLPAK